MTIYRAIGSTLTGFNETNDANLDANKANLDANDANFEANDANLDANKANSDANDANGNATQSHQTERDESLAEKIIIHLQNNPKISQQALANGLGVSRSTIQRHMTLLMKVGQLKRSGGTRGTWEVRKKA